MRDVRRKLVDLPRSSYLNLPISNECSAAGISDVYSSPAVKSDDVENTEKQKSVAVTVERRWGGMRRNETDEPGKRNREDVKRTKEKRGGEKKEEKKKKADSNLYQPLGETPAGGKIFSAFEKRGSGEVY